MRLIPCYSALSAESCYLLRQRSENPYLGSLVSTYISYWDFDEEWYLASNPDLKGSIPSDDFSSGWDHFKLIGYFEGRMPVQPHVDTDWYMTTYPDVAAAVLDGIFVDCSEHFSKLGYAEGRVPEDPDIDVDWYAQRYLPPAESKRGDRTSCTEHFVRRGYLTGALPSALGYRS